MGISDYSYHLPEELIAHAPAEPRDASRMLVYHVATDEVVFDSFASIVRHLPASALMVLNDTRVVPARLALSKVTGGSVRVLFLFNEWKRGGEIKGLPDRKVNVGDTLYLEHRPFVQAVGQQAEEFSFQPFVSAEEFESAFARHGKTPLPPYIHAQLDEAAVRERYQTVFAAPQGAQPGSVAAPTASLHFTDRVFASLAKKGIERVSVTLSVGRGTFAPVTDDVLAKGKLHSEPISVNAAAAARIAVAKREGRPVVAAGTTATRVLESAADALLAGQPFEGETSLLIAPPYRFQIVDGLITNFHLPGTSLLMLVDAFLQHRGARRSWRDLYELAVRERFRFYSFGDAMVIV